MLWFVGNSLYVSHLAEGEDISKSLTAAIYAGLGGLSWLGFRQIIQAAFLIGVINKVSDYDAYMDKTNKQRDAIEKYKS